MYVNWEEEDEKMFTRYYIFQPPFPLKVIYAELPPSSPLIPGKLKGETPIQEIQGQVESWTRWAPTSHHYSLLGTASSHEPRNECFASKESHYATGLDRMCCFQCNSEYFQPGILLGFQWETFPCWYIQDYSLKVLCKFCQPECQILSGTDQES